MDHTELMHRIMKSKIFLLYAAITWCSVSKVAVSDPQTNLLNQGCSSYNVSSLSNFNSNLNATFSLVRTG